MSNFKWQAGCIILDTPEPAQYNGWCMRAKGMAFGLAAILLPFGGAQATDSELRHIYDESVSYTPACEEGWYLLKQGEPVFSDGLPAYKAVVDFQFVSHGNTHLRSSITNFPTDFGARTVQDTREVDYLQSLQEGGTYQRGQIQLGYVVATKHISLNENVRRTCVYAEHSSITGYDLHDSPVVGGYQRPVITVRRFIGEVASDNTKWIDISIGEKSNMTFSMKVDISRGH